MDLIENSAARFRHPWELSRTDIILKNLKKLNIHGSILDIGCGDAYFDETLLSEFSNITELYGIDINLENPFTKGKARYSNTYEEIKDKKFDYILLMDVIEHIEDDYKFIAEIKRYLKDDGKIIITVPAFQRLFSIHDQELRHYRRYNYKQLKDVLDANNIEILHYTYFYLSLMLVRFFTKNKPMRVNTWNKDEKHWLTVILRAILNLDYCVLNALSKIDIHIGGLSLMVICSKK